MSKDQPRITTPEENQALLSLLGNNSIVLVGLMGAGKTTVGRRLAARMDLPFVDADSEIERAAGKSVPEIFSDHGEEEFRAGEKRVIARILQSGPQVLATGGGAFMDAETRKAISKSGVSVWLKADTALLLKRVSKRGGRPLLQQGNPEKILNELIARRYPVYGTANVTVESKDVPHQQIVTAIIETLTEYLKPFEGQS